MWMQLKMHSMWLMAPISYKKFELFIFGHGFESNRFASGHLSNVMRLFSLFINHYLFLASFRHDLWQSTSMITGGYICKMVAIAGKGCKIARYPHCAVLMWLHGVVRLRYVAAMVRREEESGRVCMDE